MSQNQKKESSISNRQRKNQIQQDVEPNIAKNNKLNAPAVGHKKTNGSINNHYRKMPPPPPSPIKSQSQALHASTSAPALLRSRKSQQQQQQQKTQREKDRAERATLVLWRKPVQTVKYCSLEVVTLLRTSGRRLLEHRALLSASIVLSILLGVIYYIPGHHQLALDIVKKYTWFVVYWVGLGVLSSVGLGTGLHTFLLYLGPHIASVTLAAYECNSLNFPSPPYPDDIICPDEPYIKRTPNIWSIMSKVRLEAFLWGAGTALGELPPYFMAKAARLSGYDPDDAEEIAEFEALNAKRNQKNLSLMDKGKLFMERVVERIGFFGILACASIPNPLFDLAGITCGHFLVPFWTFFGATLIGKAVIKMHIQKVFVIIAFNENLLEKAVDMMAKVPYFGKKLQEPFKGFLNNQKQRLHRSSKAKSSPAGSGSGNMLSKIFEMFVFGMICYFIISIINSLAQSYHKRLTKKHNKKLIKKVPAKFD